MPSYSDDQIAAALKAAKGQVYTAAKKLKCSPNTIKDRLKANPDLSAVAELEEGLLVDLAEAKLATAVRRGDKWAIQFMLKTKGKDRGYVEKQQIEHEMLTPIQIIEIELPKPPAGDDE